jgi:hypothetical protein
MTKALTKNKRKMYFTLLPYFPVSTLSMGDVTGYSCEDTVGVLQTTFKKK